MLCNIYCKYVPAGQVVLFVLLSYKLSVMKKRIFLFIFFVAALQLIAYFSNAAVVRSQVATTTYPAFSADASAVSSFDSEPSEAVSSLSLF